MAGPSPHKYGSFAEMAAIYRESIYVVCYGCQRYIIVSIRQHGDREGARWEEYYNKDTKKAIDLSTPEGKEKVSKLDENQNNTTLLVGPNPQTPQDPGESGPNPARR